MTERLKKWWLLGLLILPALACNAFAGRVDTSLPPPATLTPTVASSENENTPAIAPTVTFPAGSTPVPLEGSVRVLVDLNIRSGPGVRFDRVGFLRQGEIVPITGRDEASGWWRIPCPPTAGSAACWISGGAQYTRLEAVSPTVTP